MLIVLIVFMQIYAYYICMLISYHYEVLPTQTLKMELSKYVGVHAFRHMIIPMHGWVESWSHICRTLRRCWIMPCGHQLNAP